MFRVGMKVVCVDGTPKPGWRRPWLVEGAVYTIRAFDDNGELKLCEVIRSNDSIGFYRWRFRPAVSPKQQVSFTTGAPRDSDQWDNRRKRVEVMS